MGMRVTATRQSLEERSMCLGFARGKFNFRVYYGNVRMSYYVTHILIYWYMLFFLGNTLACSRFGWYSTIYRCDTAFILKPSAHKFPNIVAPTQRLIIFYCTSNPFKMHKLYAFSLNVGVFYFISVSRARVWWAVHAGSFRWAKLQGIVEHLLILLSDGRCHSLDESGLVSLACIIYINRSWFMIYLSMLDRGARSSIST